MVGALVVFPVMAYYRVKSQAAVANFLAAANWFLCITGGLAFILLIVRARTEERHLVARFGGASRAYAQRTGRFLPRVGALRRGA